MGVPERGWLGEGRGEEREPEEKGERAAVGSMAAAGAAVRRQPEVCITVLQTGQKASGDQTKVPWNYCRLSTEVRNEEAAKLQWWRRERSPNIEIDGTRREALQNTAEIKDQLYWTNYTGE